MRSENESPASVVMRLILGKWISRPIHTISRLRIADLLSDGPKTVEELAELTGSHAPSLNRLMRALEGIGFFTKSEANRFRLTPLGECLKTGALREASLMFHSDWHDAAWARLTDAVSTCRSGFELAFGLPFNEWLESNPEAARVLHDAQAAKVRSWNKAIIESYDFPASGTVVDIGGGRGELIVEILSEHPSLSGIVADRPEAVAAAAMTIESAGLSDRCSAVQCDFFESVPAGGDRYILSHVLHNWSDQPAIAILSNCRAAMKSGGRLLIVEYLLSEDGGPSPATLLDIEMLVMSSGGRERTSKEYEQLLQASGFDLQRTVHAIEGITIIESAPR